MDDFHLNEAYSTSPQYSPPNTAKDIGYSNTKLVCEKLTSVMPTFYVDGEISKVNVNIDMTFIGLSNSFSKNIIISINGFIEHAGCIQ